MTLIAMPPNRSISPVSPSAIGRSSDGMMRSASPAMADCGSAAAKKSEARKTDPDDNRVRLVDFIGNLQEGNTEGELERVLQSVKDANKFARLLPDSHVSFFSDRTSHPDILIVAVWVFCSLPGLTLRVQCVRRPLEPQATACSESVVFGWDFQFIAPQSVG